MNAVRDGSGNASKGVLTLGLVSSLFLAVGWFAGISFAVSLVIFIEDGPLIPMAASAVLLVLVLVVMAVATSRVYADEKGLHLKYLWGKGRNRTIPWDEIASAEVIADERQPLIKKMQLTLIPHGTQVFPLSGADTLFVSFVNQTAHKHQNTESDADTVSKSYSEWRDYNGYKPKSSGLRSVVFIVLGILPLVGSGYLALMLSNPLYVAKAAIERNRTELALRQVKRYEKKHGRTAESTWLRVQAYRSVGNAEGTLQALLQLKELSQDWPEIDAYIHDARLDWASSLIGAENFMDAAEQLTILNAEYPDEIPVIKTLANIYIMEDRANAAVPYIQQLKRLLKKPSEEDMELLRLVGDWDHHTKWQKCNNPLLSARLSLMREQIPTDEITYLRIELRNDTDMESVTALQGKLKLMISPEEPSEAVKGAKKIAIVHEATHPSMKVRKGEPGYLLYPLAMPSDFSGKLTVTVLFISVYDGLDPLADEMTLTCVRHKPHNALEAPE